MKILFMGTPDYAEIILDSLIKNDFNIVGVYTQPDKPVGRKQILTPPPVKKLAQQYQIPVFQPTTLQGELANIKELKPDFIVVAAFGMILPKEILEYTPCINLHASLLPKYRGASPIQSSILNKDKWTGITAMLMNEGLDTGDILGFEYIEVGDKTAPQLFEELAKIASDLTIFVLNNFSKIEPLRQNSVLTSYSPKIKKEDGFIEFKDANTIYRKYLAFYYWPQIWTTKFKIKKLSLVDSTTKNRAGEILEIKKDSIIVGCEKGKIEIFELQPISKKVMNVIDYLNGRGLKVGDNLL